MSTPSNGNGRISAQWLLNLLALILIGLLSFWGRSLAEDIRAARDTGQALGQEFSGMRAQRQSDNARLDRIEFKLDRLLEMPRR